MQVVIRSDEDAINAALRMARACHYFITGEVRGAEEIVPGHRLDCPLVNKPFWIVKLVLEPPPVTSRIKIQLSGVSDDLLLLVTQQGRVFNWPNADEDFEQFCSEAYVAESSPLQLVPSRSKKVTREEWRQICIESNHEIERLLEELDRKCREKRERDFWSEDVLSETPPEGVFELPTMEEFLAQLGEETRRSGEEVEEE